MTPRARVASAIELLTEIEGAAAPADRVVNAYFRRRRFAGSGDRAAIVTSVYRVLRRRAELDWWIARAGGERPEGEAGARRRVLVALVRFEGGSSAEIADLFGGGGFAAPSLDESERDFVARLAEAGAEAEAMPEAVRDNYPDWLDGVLKARFGGDLAEEMRAMNARAPVDLRVNSLKAERETVLARLRAEGIGAEPCALSPLGIRLTERARVTGHALYREGRVEVQDEGSQLIALLVGARAGEQVVDLCAGAGGKTLVLAAEMKNRGQVFACDIGAGRLRRMAPRLKRAGARNVQSRRLEAADDPWLDRLQGKADRVLLDVPCSGSGAWRRNPDAKWRLDAGVLERHIEIQRGLLARAERLVKAGGRLVYATCSVLGPENEAQVEWFLARDNGFTMVPVADVWAETIGGDCPVSEPWLMLTPRRHEVDGFFAAVFERTQDGALAER